MGQNLVVHVLAELQDVLLGDWELFRLTRRGVALNVAENLSLVYGLTLENSLENLLPREHLLLNSIANLLRKMFRRHWLFQRL